MDPINPGKLNDSRRTDLRNYRGKRGIVQNHRSINQNRRRIRTNLTSRNDLDLEKSPISGRRIREGRDISQSVFEDPRHPHTAMSVCRRNDSNGPRRAVQMGLRFGILADSPANFFAYRKNGA
jgi:hypothetical protein